MNDSSRRDLLKLAGLAAMGAGAAHAQSGSMADVRFEPREKVRLGAIGVGGRGDALIDDFSAGRAISTGSKGIFRDYPRRIYFDGQKDDDFGPLDPYKAKYEHPLWARMGEIAQDPGGHGGMDFIMAYRLIECIRNGTAPDIDVYDAAAWSAPGPLSEGSVASGGMPRKSPDFTRGKWRTRKPV